MPPFLISIIVSMGMKFLTQSVIERLLLTLLKQLSKSTENQLDDELVEVIQEALRPAPKAGTENDSI